jgi:aldehyde:ferredoxin oxidoreductase
MKGWNGKILRIDLTEGTAIAEEYSEDFARRFVGGRGFAIKLLWDELAPGVDPLGPENMLIFATGPLTGHVIPNSGKMVVATKSPITGGYGDGNLGSWASVNLRKAGLDAIVVKGKSPKPVYLHVENDDYTIEDASDLWGLDSYQAETKLKERHGRAAGALLIGPSGENMCRVSTVVSQEGRAGGRPGMGAVMGSKNLKAVVLRGTKALQAHDIDELNRLGKQGYDIILEKESYNWWKRQGTMAILEWCQEAETLPTHNFREGVFDEADAINGYSMENATIKQKGCPNCNMTC